LCVFAELINDKANTDMKNRTILIIALVAVLTLPASALAQGGQGQNGPNTQARTAQPSIQFPPGWKPCPRCQNNEDRRQDAVKYKIQGHPFDRHDLTGVWGYDGNNRAFTNPPELTPLGKQQHDATFGAKAADGTPLHSKDTSGRGLGSKINCDPLGWPRLYTYNYGFEFVTLPDRVIQFFEIGHTFRTIWTDGRKLPAEPPEPRWMGWNVGHWEGDTFVVESNGYDDRSWLQESRPDGGWTHSDEMRVIERYRRVDYSTLESEVTVIDPKIYKQPWVTQKATTKLVPGAEIGEDYCVPSDYLQFNENIYGTISGTKK